MKMNDFNANNEQQPDKSYDIVTDGGSDLEANRDIFSNSKNISVAQLGLTREDTGEDVTGTMNVDEFYRSMIEDGVKYRTNAPTPGNFEDEFRPILEDGRDLLYLGFTPGLSSAFQTGKMVAEFLKDDYPDRRIECIDSHCASVGLARLVVAAEAARLAGVSLDENIRRIQEEKYHMSHQFTLTNFDTIADSGRFGKLTPILRVASALNMAAPMELSGDGELVPTAKINRASRKSVIKYIANMASQMIVDGDKIIIAYGGEISDNNYDNRRNGKYNADLLRAALDNLGVPVAEQYARIGEAIGAHTGSSVASAFFWQKEPRTHFAESD